MFFHTTEPTIKSLKAPFTLFSVALSASFAFYILQIYSWHNEQQGVTQLFQQSFKSSINQYEYLPALLAQDQQIKSALQYSQLDHSSLSQHLLFVAQRSGSSEAYVMNTLGIVIASSNFNKPNSFLNKNYSFRPYFAKAVAQRTRQFYYAIGATTGIPGFFISEPVIGDNEALLGVVVVKLNLSDWEKSWHSSKQNILLSDDNNVIILSGQSRWRYKTIGHLSENTLIAIKEQRQFRDESLINLITDRFHPTQFLGLDVLFWQLEDGLYLVNAFAINNSGWILYSLKKNESLVKLAFIFFVLFLMGLSLSFLYLSERRSKLFARQQAEQEIKKINASLEDKVQSRTKSLRDAQDELLQQNKIAALGKMAATIVHELSQPLSAMNSSIAAIGLKAEKQDWQGLTKSVARLSPLSQKMNAVIKMLKSFSYQDNDASKKYELAPLITKSLSLYKDCLKEKNIHLNPLLLQANVFIKVNPVKLDLVIVNIIQNAIDAMEKCTHAEITITLNADETSAFIKIDDNGGGIDSRVMGQLFTPYYTTKDIGKGLGLGLSICHEIIREYGGLIDVKNIPHGARFMIKLPLYKE